MALAAAASGVAPCTGRYSGVGSGPSPPNRCHSGMPAARAARSQTATSRGAFAYGCPVIAAVIRRWTDCGLRGSAPKIADASTVTPAIWPGRCCASNVTPTVPDSPMPMVPSSATTRTTTASIPVVTRSPDMR